MKIALAQISPKVGAFEENVQKIREEYRRACNQQARLFITSEMSLCGYPPLDLMERPEMMEKTEKALSELMDLTRNQSCALAVGHIDRSPFDSGRPFQNVVTVLEKGKIVFRQAKTLLPTYDVFDEMRYFEPARESQVWVCDGIRIGIAICEDLWIDSQLLGKPLYPKTFIEKLSQLKPDLLVSVSASPYEWAKYERREAIHRGHAAQLKIPLICVNQVGATDEILFDGGSFVVDSKGNQIGRLPFFKPSFGIVEFVPGGVVQWSTPEVGQREDQAPLEIEILFRALVTGMREYFAKTGFKKAILGLSGGIDSAVVAVLATHALGAKNVLGIAMPSQYSSSHSLEDAEKLAQTLGMPFEVRPIKFLFSMASRGIAEGRGTLAPVALENLQSRIRGLTLMTLSNHDAALVLAPGNKSEFATGYCTLYGDMNGALAPLGDVYKTRVYELAEYINKAYRKLIPERTLTKPPSAELRPDQTDQDSLPPYDELDEILFLYLEQGVSVAALEEKGLVRAREIVHRVEMNEYKRRQAAPILKVSQKAFGLGRRIPIAKTWES